MQSNKEELRKKLQEQPSEENLLLLPIFTGRRNKLITLDMLNKSYHPDVSISSILFNNRANGILEKAAIKTIGQLLLTSYGDLLNYRNCGLQTIEVFHNELKNYILQKKYDYTPYWSDMESMLRNVVKIKERNFQVLLYRLGVHQKRPFTLQKCGDKFGITREAIRQTLSRIIEIINHPETEFKLRPFWSTIDKILKKKELVLSDELAKKIKENLDWKIKPEPHSIERLLKMKPDKYVVTHTHLVGLNSSKCFTCSKFDALLPEIMGNEPKKLYKSVYRVFYDEIEKECPRISSFSKTLVKTLVDMQIYKNISLFPKFKKKSNLIINKELFVISKK